MKMYQTMPTHFLSFSLHTLPYGQKVEGSAPLLGQEGCVPSAVNEVVDKRNVSRTKPICFISGFSHFQGCRSGGCR